MKNMNKTLISLDDAIRYSLPQMIKNKNALNAIVEIIADTISSNNFDVCSNVIETLIGKGGNDEFLINIHEFHGIFWITVPEFDDDGFFTDKDDAIAFAKVRYESYINNY